MGFLQLGRFNFADLVLVIWKSADHFLPFQTFIFNYFFTFIANSFGPGVIIGGTITVNSGMSIDIASFTVIFPGGEMANFPATLNAATLSNGDGADPRLDRIEILFAETNNATVVNTLLVTKQLDKHKTAQIIVSEGTPAGAPVANALAGGSISLGIISVAQSQTTLLNADIDQAQGTAKQISRKVGELQFEQDLDNTIATVDIVDLKLDGTVHRKSEISYWSQRRTDSVNDKIESGLIVSTFNVELSTWKMQYETDGDDLAEILLTITAAGQMEIRPTTILAGANYDAKFVFKIERTIEA